MPTIHTPKNPTKYKTTYYLFTIEVHATVKESASNFIVKTCHHQNIPTSNGQDRPSFWVRSVITEQY